MEHATDWDLSHRVVGACIEVDRTLGPGLLESIYEECVCRELELAGLAFERQATLPVCYKGAPLPTVFRLDVVVERRLLVELEAVERLLPVHEAQLLTYLKISRIRVGLLVNFNSPTLIDGLRRLSLAGSAG